MPNTTNIKLVIPTHGTFVDTWDVPVNGDFTSLDGFLGGVQVVNAAGASPITLTSPAGSVTPAGGPTQSENAVLRFSGILTGNVQVTLPLPGYMIIENLTTGAFVLSFRAVTAGQVIGVEQGSIQHIYNDGTNVRFVNLSPVGTYLDVCDAAVPAWVTACTVPPYLLCDGSAFSAVTYPYLNSKLGGTTLPDFRGCNRFYLNGGTGRLTTAGAGIDGDTRFASGGSNGVTLAANQVPSLNSSGNNSITVGPTPGLSITLGNGFIQGVAVQNASSATVPFISGGTWVGASSLSGTNAITVSYTNASQQVVKNATPGAVGGITLIRAA